MKENIIVKASELFSRLGFKSVTMDDLAEAMSISKKRSISILKTSTPLYKNADNLFLITSVKKFTP